MYSEGAVSSSVWNSPWHIHPYTFDAGSGCRAAVGIPLLSLSQSTNLVSCSCVPSLVRHLADAPTFVTRRMGIAYSRRLYVSLSYPLIGVGLSGCLESPFGPQGWFRPGFYNPDFSSLLFRTPTFLFARRRLVSSLVSSGNAGVFVLVSSGNFGGILSIQ